VIPQAARWEHTELSRPSHQCIDPEDTEMTRPTVLISGASIAGPALAFWFTHFESIGQVRAARWSLSRVALTGDAAWCASPISGMSTSLAIVGAPRILNPRTQLGLGVLRPGLRAASSGPAKRLGNRFFPPPADKIVCPIYTHLERTPSM